MTKLKYCTLRDTKTKGPCTIYVSMPEDVVLNPAVVDDPNFPEVKGILESYGFKHVMFMTFRTLEGTVVRYRAMHAELKRSGFVRDQSIADAIHEQMESLKTTQRRSILVVPYNTSAVTQSHTGVPLFGSDPYSLNWNKLMMGGIITDLVRKKKPRTLDPATVIGVGDKLDLYVYLFLRMNPTNNGVDFELEFDLMSRESDVLRKYVKTIKCTFIRKDEDTDGIMYLESESTLRDILKEVDFLYNIRLVHPANAFGDKLPPIIYNAIELKDFLELEGRMSLHVDIQNNYDELLMLSDEIGKKKMAHDKNMQVPIALIRKASKSIIQRMEQRMHHYSDQENYELAASYYKSKVYIENKMKLLEDLEAKGVDRLNNDEYESAFTMKDMDF